ncbi:MAG: gamma carbonic anhydrase family protein, partial [Akkermansia sp.]
MPNQTMAIEEFYGTSPSVDSTSFVAASADLIGAVTAAEDSSIWYNTTLRGDINSISIGKGSNLQDNSCMHVADDYGCHLGDYVTIGHCVCLHACTIEDKCLIGMGATVLDGAVIGHGSIVGANALVTKGTIIPPHSLVLGSPAKVVKTVEAMEEANYLHALKYVKLAKRFR